MQEPPVYVFKISHHGRTVRIGRRTRDVKLQGLALADLGALPPPTPVDE